MSKLVLSLLVGALSLFTGFLCGSLFTRPDYNKYEADIKKQQEELIAKVEEYQDQLIGKDTRINILNDQINKTRAELENLSGQNNQTKGNDQYVIGRKYATGNGLPFNIQEALNWYKKAAEQGNADAQNDLGVMYATGKGVSQDYEEAVKWMHKAAEQRLLNGKTMNCLYEIADEDKMQSIKRTLIIDLKCKVTEPILQAMANWLKSLDNQEYERTFMLYYLPGMKKGAGAWATSHFNPELKIKILGLTLREEKELIALKGDDKRITVGSWIDNRMKARINIFRLNSQFYYELILYRNGETLSCINELIPVNTKDGLVYWDKTEDEFREHSTIEKNGDLRIEDNDGIFYTVQKIP